MMIKPKTKEVDSAYVLLAVASDPKLARENLDALVKASEEADKAAADARTLRLEAEDKMRKATESMAIYRQKEEELNRNLDDYYQKLEQLELDNDAYDARVKSFNEQVIMRTDSLDERDKALKEREDKIASDRMAADIAMGKALSMKTEYEGKLKKLKEMV